MRKEKRGMINRRLTISTISILIIAIFIQGRALGYASSDDGCCELDEDCYTNDCQGAPRCMGAQTEEPAPWGNCYTSPAPSDPCKGRDQNLCSFYQCKWSVGIGCAKDCYPGFNEESTTNYCYPECQEGIISSKCFCGASLYQAGYCCKKPTEAYYANENEYRNQCIQGAVVTAGGVSGNGGWVKVTDNKEEIVLQDENDQIGWAEAERDGLFNYTKIWKSGNIYFLDFISNKMPKPDETSKCGVIAVPKKDGFGDDYYVYQGSNFGWIGRKPDDSFPLDNFEQSTGRLYSGKQPPCQPNPHIRALYNRVQLNSRFSPLGGGSTQPSGQQPTDFSVNFIPLMDAEAIEGSTAAGAGRGASQPPPTGPTSISLLPEFICAKRNNIAFWAGCGASIESSPPHNFYPGGTLTTIEDFGLAPSASNLKPGTNMLYNRVLALGTITIGAEISYDIVDLQINPTKYNNGVIYDWSNYEKLVLYFKAVRKPESYKLEFSSLKSGSCAIIGRELKITDFISKEAKQNKWYKVEIPVEQISTNPAELKGICRITIKADGDDFKPLQQNLQLTSVSRNINFRDVAFLDRFSLVSNTQNDYYCGFIDTDKDPAGAADVAQWIKDIDNDAGVCNEQPSYIWTGNRCCGDDGSSDTYIDDKPNNYACWEGSYAANDELITATVLKK